MSSVAVFASGRGTNFAAIYEYLRGTNHSAAVLVTDKHESGAARFAAERDIPVLHALYGKTSRATAERRLIAKLEPYRIDAIALAGFMRVLTPCLVDAYRDRILNLHPSLLPKHPGLGAIRKSYDAGDPLGITIHKVDEGVDTGPIVEQHAVPNDRVDTLEEAERAVRELEHFYYPRAVAALLDSIEQLNRQPQGRYR